MTLVSKRVKKTVVILLFVAAGIFVLTGSGSITAQEQAEQPKLSPQTQTCIACHKLYTPGIVEDWLTSRHSKTTPAQAMKKPELERRISAQSVSEELADFAVGCYECHSRNPEKHKDNFVHMGFKINVIVSPNDCSTCHTEEVKQYSDSKKAHAWDNIIVNPVYHTLVTSITGVKKVEGTKITSSDPTEQTLNESCIACHGTEVRVKGTKSIKTAMGEMQVPDLSGWPNQGVGRKNPDGSVGSCTACHPRHSFSIEIARKPYTCGQCHLEPDVPAYNVYKESKHGNIFTSKWHTWNFNNVPWVIGQDFTAPTCATCHNSLIVSPTGKVIAQRSHNFGARLWVRLFGLIYSHPQPKSGNTTIIKNKDGLPLPTAFTGEPASEFLIDKDEQAKRKAIMVGVCNSCHNTDWINNHFAKMDNTIKETNEMTAAATNLMTYAWSKGIEDKTNPFDETIEKMWIKQWLFYSNSIRYASAMTGAPDYAAFKNGWWSLSENLQNMKDHIELKAKMKGIILK
ncbi:MAG: cytochrome c3 family protein [Nitrospiraceae bacterium]|nr:cytochrome c3 family protein [Nitrospiraceae bacterium]